MFYLLNTPTSLVIIFWKNIQVFFHLGIYIDLPKPFHAVNYTFRKIVWHYAAKNKNFK